MELKQPCNHGYTLIKMYSTEKVTVSPVFYFAVGWYMFAFKAGLNKFSSSTLMMTLLWLALFRCLRKHQLPTHLRPIISVEQLLSFLCHNKFTLCGHRLSALQDQPHKAIRLSSFLPSLSPSHFALICECMQRGNAPSPFMLHAKCQLSFLEQARY